MKADSNRTGRLLSLNHLANAYKYAWVLKWALSPKILSGYRASDEVGKVGSATCRHLINGL